MFPYNQAIEQHPGPATMDKTKGGKWQLTSVSMEWDFPVLMHRGLNKMVDILQEEFPKTICWKYFFIYSNFTNLFLDNMLALIQVNLRLATEQEKSH